MSKPKVGARDQLIAAKKRDCFWRLILDALIAASPPYWMMHYKYSETWDEELRFLLNNYMFTEIGQYTARLSGVLIWTANHPYASFHRYEPCRPRRLTIVKAQRKLLADLEVQNQTPTPSEAKIELDIRETAALAVLMQRVYDRKVEPLDAVYQVKNNLHVQEV